MDTRKDFPLSRQGWGCQVERMESQSHRPQWEKRSFLCVLEPQQLMKGLPGQSLKAPSVCQKGTMVSGVSDLQATGEGLD